MYSGTEFTSPLPLSIFPEEMERGGCEADGVR